MAHFTFTRTGGVWVTAPPNPLLATEVADLDLKTYKSINGDDGGSWAPAAAIAIGGAGLALGGSNHQVLSGGAVVWLNGSLLQVNASGAATFLCTVALDGGATVASAHSLTMSSGSTFTASAGSNVGIQTGSHVTASFDSSCTLLFGTNCNFTIQADALADVLLGAGSSFALSGGCTASIGTGTTLNVAGTVLVNSGGSVVIDTGANLTIKEPVIPVGDGRIRRRVLTKSSDAAQSLAIGDCDILYCPPALLSVDRKVTMSNTGAATGDIIEIVNYDPTYTLSVYQADGTTLIAYVRRNGTNHWSLRMMYLTASSTWIPIGGDKDVPLRAADPSLRSADLHARDRLVRRRALPCVRALRVGALVVVDLRSHAVRGGLGHCGARRPRPAASPRRPSSAPSAADAVRVALAVRGARLGARSAARTGARLLVAGHASGLRPRRPAAVPRVGRARRQRRQRHHEPQDRQDPRHAGEGSHGRRGRHAKGEERHGDRTNRDRPRRSLGSRAAPRAPRRRGDRSAIDEAERHEGQRARAVLARERRDHHQRRPCADLRGRRRWRQEARARQERHGLQGEAVPVTARAPDVPARDLLPNHP
jgi:hypothetical protein